MVLVSIIIIIIIIIIIPVRTRGAPFYLKDTVRTAQKTPRVCYWKKSLNAV
jgi:hypothetical protein